MASIGSYDPREEQAAPTRNLFIPASLSDVDFGCLFASPASPPADHQFFADGLPSTAQDDAQDSPDDFSFDQMVDLDACQPHSDPFHDSDNNDRLLPESSSNYFSSLSSRASADHPHQVAATSSALQPCLGASS